jgi:hypothetical protein
MNVCSSVGLEIRDCSIGIHMRTERGQQSASNSLALDGGFDGHWSQMPVRPRRIAMRPCIGPVQNAKRRAEWIAEQDCGQHAELFKRSRLTKAGPCNAADGYKLVIAISAVNHPPLVETEQYRPEEPFQRPTAPLRVRYCKGPDVHGIVAHCAAEDQGCWSKVGSSQLAQFYYAVGFHSDTRKVK